MVGADVTVTVSEFIVLLNQTLDFAYPQVTVTGEIANFKLSKGRWVYFDLKDEQARVRFFGTVAHLPGPLEDGMLLAVTGRPRLHPQFGFKVNIVSIRPMGEGSIKKAAALLEAKLKREGLFDPARKRMLPYPPAQIGLITSGESAAYRDVTKILNARWGGMEILHIDVQVQGEDAPRQIIAAVEQFNQLANPPQVLVITRGGGSAEDLQAFSTEQVTRAVAASRIPTLVAIGHEVDISLAELAADQRASTPSNAAELLVPDRKHLRTSLQSAKERLGHLLERTAADARALLEDRREFIHDHAERAVSQNKTRLQMQAQLLEAFNPQAALNRGYALVRKGQKVVRRGSQVKAGDQLNVQISDAVLESEVKQVIMSKNYGKK